MGAEPRPEKGAVLQVIVDGELSEVWVSDLSAIDYLGVGEGTTDGEPG